MRTIKKLIFLVITSLTFAMCTEDTPDLSNIALFVTPGNDSIPIVYSGDKTQYQLEISTINEYIKRLTISSFDAQFGDVVLSDSVFNTDKKNCVFIYHAPEIDRDSINVVLNFRAEDNEGNAVDVKRSLVVKNRYVSMSERDGIVLYSSESGLPDALSFADVTQPFTLSESPDSLSADIYVFAEPNSNVISWKSKTKTKFIRNNSFNYVAATASSINNVYQSSIRTDIVSDIMINDIILVGHGNSADGAFCVKNIIRDNSIPGGFCLQISYKAIKSQ